MSLQLQLLLAVILSTFSALSYAIDCSRLDRKSDAFQTCMLRQENTDRDIRNQIVNERMEREKADNERRGNVQNEKLKDSNLDALLELSLAIEKKLICNDSDSAKLEPAIEKNTFGYALSVCRNPSFAMLLFSNRTHLARELSSEIENKKISAFYFNDLRITNQSTSINFFSDGKASAILFTQPAAQPQTNVIAISEMLKKRSPVEVFVKGEKSSSSFAF